MIRLISKGTVKRISSFAVMLALLLSLFAVEIPASAADESVWDGTSVDTDWYGDGSATEFEISTAAELAGLISLTCSSGGTNFAGKTINITSDIDLNRKSWIPLGTSKNFAGILDGNGHTIRNLTITATAPQYHGLFAITSGCTIQNLTIDTLNDSNSQMSGAFVGYAMRTTIKNCHVKNANFNTTQYYCGGLVGVSTRYLKAYDCSFTNGSIRASYYAGGIVGPQQNDEGSEIKHCVVDLGETGIISGKYYVGGIVGQVNRIKQCRAIYEDCTIYGNITANGYIYGVGGIIGMDSTGTSSYNLTIKNCVSFANINATSSSNHDSISIGGIIGYMNGTNFNLSSSYVDILDYCDYYGNISVHGSGTFIVGGIAGFSSGIIKNCANFGTINCPDVYNAFVGGITGCTQRNNVNVFNSYNKGNVSTNSGSAGTLSGYHGYSNSYPNYYMFDNVYNVGKATNNAGTSQEYQSTETIIGKLFWGHLKHTYWLKTNTDTDGYKIFDTLDNVALEDLFEENTTRHDDDYLNKDNDLGHFYGSDLKNNNPLSSSNIFNINLNPTRPFSIQEQSSTDNNLLKTLNEQVNSDNGYLNWVVYPENDSAENVTNEDAIPEKEEAYAKVYNYKYPMLGHTSTIEYATAEDENRGNAEIVSTGVDNADDAVYDAAYRTVNVDPKPKTGFSVKDVTAVDGYGRDLVVNDNGDGTYSYTMPRTAVTVTISYDMSSPIKFHTNEPGSSEDKLFRVYNADESSDLNPEDGYRTVDDEGKIEHFYDIPSFAEDDYVFAGWYYNSADGTVDGDTPFNFDEAVPEGVTDVYAHWIAVGTVTKDGDDDKKANDDYFTTEYKGYDLVGVQIRKEDKRDLNYGDYMPGGLRFINVISNNMLSEIDALSDKTVGDNNNKVEYGFVTAAKSTVDTVAGAPEFNIDSSTYKLQYKGKNVNGVDTTVRESSDKNFNYVTNVDCTAKPYSAGTRANFIDHRNYTEYRISTFVITYENDADGTHKASDVVARAYLRYYDANGKLRTFYNDYEGTSVYGGCSTSYDKAVEAMASNENTAR